MRVGFATPIAAIWVMAALSTCMAQTQPDGNAQQSKHKGDLLVEIKIVQGKLMGTGEEASLSNVVSYLQKTADANIVMPAELGGIRIGDLELRDSPVYLALQAVALAGGNQFVFEERQDNMNRVGPDAKPLFMLEKVNPPGPPPAPAQPAEASVEAFSLTGYLSAMKLDPASLLADSGDSAQFERAKAKLKDTISKLQDVICETYNAEQAYAPSPGTGSAPSVANTSGKSLEVKFYEDADLLIVIGPWNGVQAARTIIHALPGQTANGFPNVMSQPR
ncbi:MAG TPA: hypothetical protein VGN61_14825 [Verrucomicrobiae bacterium]